MRVDSRAGSPARRVSPGGEDAWVPRACKVADVVNGMPGLFLVVVQEVAQGAADVGAKSGRCPAAAARLEADDEDAEQRGIGDATLEQLRADGIRLSREYMTGEPLPRFTEMRR